MKVQQTFKTQSPVFIVALRVQDGAQKTQV
jgi:hypothetical protein